MSNDKKPNTLEQTGDRCPNCQALRVRGNCTKCQGQSSSCAHKPGCNQKNWGNSDCKCGG